MRKPEADAWALEVLNHIKTRQSFETTHLELKQQVIPAKDFVRQLAGLANAARWSPVLVIIGADRKGIRGIEPFEVGDCYAQLRAQFEYGEAPALLYQNFLLFGDKTVGVFVFATDNPPYVIGADRRGSSREVPWRYGSNTGPAGRYELLQVLLQKAHEPDIETMSVSLRATRSRSMQLTYDIFVYPATSSEPLMIPAHRIDVRCADAAGRVVQLPISVSLVPPRQHATAAELVDSGIVVRIASKLQLNCFSAEGDFLDTTSPTVDVSVSMLPARFTAPVHFAAQIHRRDHPDFPGGYWELPEQHGQPLHTIADDLERIKRTTRKRIVPPSFLR